MMNGDQMAAEVIQAIGGRVTPARLKAFRAMCNAIVKHIQTNMQVTSSVVASGPDAQGGVVASTGTATSTTVQ